jgi:hypothetical protein
MVIFIFKIPELNETSNELEATYLKRIKKHNALLDLSEENNETKKSKYININSALTFYKFKLLIIQNIGIIIGFSVMLIMARYSKSIEIQ